MNQIVNKLISEIKAPTGRRSDCRGFFTPRIGSPHSCGKQSGQHRTCFTSRIEALKTCIPYSLCLMLQRDHDNRQIQQVYSHRVNITQREMHLSSELFLFILFMKHFPRKSGIKITKQLVCLFLSLYDVLTLLDIYLV